MFDSTYSEALSMLREGHSADEVAQCVADALNDAVKAYEDEQAQKNKTPTEAETKVALRGFLAGLNDLYTLFSGEGLDDAELDECVDEAMKAISDASNDNNNHHLKVKSIRHTEPAPAAPWQKVGPTDDDFDIFLKNLRKIIN